MSSLDTFQISPAPATVADPISSTSKEKDPGHLKLDVTKENEYFSNEITHSIHHVTTAIPSSNEESDKASAALALSALAGSNGKRTHSPTCVTESTSYPPFAASTPSNHGIRPMAFTDTPSCGRNAYVDHSERQTDPRTMTVTPMEPSKRLKTSTGSFVPRGFAVPTPPLPGSGRKESESSSFPRGSHAMVPMVADRHFQTMNQPLPADSYLKIGASAYPNNLQVDSLNTTIQGSKHMDPSCAYSFMDYSRDFMLHDQGQDMDIPPNQQLLPDGTYKRRDKSLGVLCVNFMLRYNKMKMDQPQSTPAVSIDEASAYLAVERRRIYDIINILEAINVVSRKCKNTYNWHGMDGILDTFFALQKEAIKTFEQDAIKTGFKAKMEEMGIEYEEEIKTEQRPPSPPAMPAGLAMLLAGAEQVDQKSAKKTLRKKVVASNKEKSLGRLSQKFIQLFLVGNETIALTDASDKILGETPVPELPLDAPAEEIMKARNMASKLMKTKIRRLYDIANVLASIGLILKLNGGNNMNNAMKNRPSFKWTYPVSPSDIMALGAAKKNCKQADGGADTA